MGKVLDLVLALLFFIYFLYVVFTGYTPGSFEFAAALFLLAAHELKDGLD